METFNANKLQNILDAKVSKSDTINIKNGGTGASTLPNARKNLNIMPQVLVGNYENETPANPYYKVFTCNIDRNWQSYTIRMLINCFNPVNYYFKPFEVNLMIKAGNGVKNNPIIVTDIPISMADYTNIMDCFIIAQDNTTSTGNCEVWFKATKSYQSVKVTIIDTVYRGDNANVYNSVDNIVLNPNGIVPVASIDLPDQYTFTSIAQSSIQTALDDKLSKSETIGITNGGTGQTSLTGLRGLMYAGLNTINNTTNDTVSNWSAQRFSLHEYNQSNCLTDQPNTYGLLLNLTNNAGSAIHQVWLNLAKGALYHRSGNAEGWLASWQEILDTTNCANHVLPLNKNGTYYIGEGGEGQITIECYEEDSEISVQQLIIHTIKAHNDSLTIDGDRRFYLKGYNINITAKDDLILNSHNMKVNNDYVLNLSSGEEINIETEKLNLSNTEEVVFGTEDDRNLGLKFDSNECELWIGVLEEDENPGYTIITNDCIMKNSLIAYYNIYPYNNNEINLGDTNKKWANIYATNGTIQTSDKNEKNTIKELTTEQAKNLILNLKPSTYKMNSGTSNRTHWGLISQDIEELMNNLNMTSLDFAGFIKSPKTKAITEDENGNKLKKPIEKIIEGEYNYSLRYDEFIAPMIKVIQDLNNEIEQLKTEISKLKNKEG